MVNALMLKQKYKKFKVNNVDISFEVLVAPSYLSLFTRSMRTIARDEAGIVYIKTSTFCFD